MNNKQTKILSLFIFGWGNFKFKQYTKAALLFLAEVLGIIYFSLLGFKQLGGLRTLGVNKQQIIIDEFNIPRVILGDNSMLMLLHGVVALVILAFFIALAYQSYKEADYLIKLVANNEKVPSFKANLATLLDKNFHILLLAIPLVGLLIFTIIPLLYMILIAFTSYDQNHQPPGELFSWVGLDNFIKIFSFNSSMGSTFASIFAWTSIWAILATFSCYFGGMLLAILINRKGIKGKGFFRIVFVLTIAIPSFISLLVIRTMLQKNGIINTLLMEYGFIKEPLPFLTDKTWARSTVVIVNMWLGIPYSMLITSGILLNIPADQYESAKLDGASAFQQFKHITLPYMIFVTTPYLISNFIANFNNFNAIFFLTEGGPATLDSYKSAGSTDLLVTWLYKLTVSTFDYNLASAIGIIIFLVSASLSLVLFKKTVAYKEEERFR